MVKQTLSATVAELRQLVQSNSLQDGKAKRLCFWKTCIVTAALLGLSSVALAATPPSPAPEADPFQLATEPLPNIDYSVTPVNGEITMVLRNNTGAEIEFEAVGQTNNRLLSGFSNVTLTNLELPLLFTFQRPDRGFLQVNVQTDEPRGVVEVTFTIAPNFEADRTAISINERGEISVN